MQVREWIAKMKLERKAFFTSRTYLLAGVLLEKNVNTQKDLMGELLAVMTSLQ